MSPIDSSLAFRLAEQRPELNGRQIRSIVRLTTMQADAEGEERICERHLEMPLRYFDEFAKEVKQGKK